jgi:hypothetical protein
MSVHTVGGDRLAFTSYTPRSAALTQVGAFQNTPLTTTVPKEFVHRASVAEVLLTDWHRSGDDRFAVRAQWPRGHSFFTPVNGRHDPLIAAETIRQVAPLIAHTEFGIPLGHCFLMWDLTVAVEPEELVVGATPASLEIEAVCTDVKERRGAVTGLRCNAVIRRDQQVVATGTTSFTATSPAVYRRLRHGRVQTDSPLTLTAPAAPQTVQRTSPMDVVLTPVGQPDVWQLRVDTRHPVLFDHPVDHVPGMVLLEAARQAGCAYLDGPCQLVSVSSEFENYVELDAPCMVEVSRVSGPDAGSRQVLLVTFHQNGQPLARATVTMAATAA